ncbi:PREDICTED: NADH dehydrogenase [ubiquinone] iron-sulfur protein 6, mitochondrial-like [Amphimedon queenslandica]|uniref:Zinc finger CHCC-type domain-containing protein n=1 Tax=Amphimedon queenslandica TaxID=400682 RepID=A0A1X7VH15_AMPQE|nr:PREDICTED: NADH dehydrogenase [ubiquinone] iron-sulfur protein 6, mitochondrial-like [Amphimedon queenslandica]|eukprot:XP_003384396.1 PREDICTED: NADH dehydrogenase [ubiquinone] iron-sulfur protein 6, mitochondrial-like [Amphimedon queenslandica]
MAARFWRTGIVTSRLFLRRRTVFSSAARLGSNDKVTHTGQKWEETDYRNVRFIDREKQVNEQFAIDLLAEEPVTLISGRTHTYCDGGHGALGHPKVYINLDKPEINDCGYCGKRFLASKHKNLFPNEQFEDLQ